jgi:hypothetical protein
MTGETMTTSAETMTLTEFLLARIAEDAAEASFWYRVWDRVREEEESLVNRVLAECEAKRQIVEEWPDNDGCDLAGSAYGDHAMLEAAGEKAMHARVLRHLAAIYADHHDYREEWKP